LDALESEDVSDHIGYQPVVGPAVYEG